MANLDKKILDNLATDAQTQGNEISNLSDNLKRTEGYMIGIGLVVGIGFVSLLLTSFQFFTDSLRFKASTYQSLVDKVNQVNERITNESEIKNKEEIERLQSQITELRKMNSYLK